MKAKAPFGTEMPESAKLTRKRGISRISDFTVKVEAVQASVRHRSLQPERSI